jgi:hypothetical protein
VTDWVAPRHHEGLDGQAEGLRHHAPAHTGLPPTPAAVVVVPQGNG